MKAAVIVFPGSNCDQDCVHALEHVAEVQVDAIWHQESSLSGYDLIVLPGGFSYGDYLRTGAIARFSPVMEAVKERAEAGALVLGICNGFQILLEAGLLPGAMLRNRSLKFICQDQPLQVERTDTAFTNQFTPGQIISLPIAHGEGNYTIDPEGLKALEEGNQILFRYHGQNPNGSVANIAGICNSRGNVLGMMPHPERAVEAILGGTDGLTLFRSVLRWKEVMA